MSIVELRQYTLHPNQREVLIDLFDREFVETQEAVGIRVLGQFRDQDDPDRFVWLRSFPDMVARRAALTAFYVHSEAWRRHGPAASATMVDSSNALLLRPVWPEPDFPAPVTARPPVGTTEPRADRVLATISTLKAPADEEFIRFFEHAVVPVLADSGARPLAWLRTAAEENTFPRLPVRTGENVFVWFSSFVDDEHLRDHRERLAGTTAWTQRVRPELATWLTAEPRQLRLAPTARCPLW